jgi:cobalt transporter subunit CbtA
MIASAMAAGIIAGSTLFIVQRWTTLPLIYQAEFHEQERSRVSSPTNDPPQGETTRSAYTLLGDIFVAIGFGLMLSAAYVLSDKFGLRHGIFWGLAGFTTFQLGPALVVPPALPGLQLVSLSTRQGIWLIAAFSTGLGLALVIRERKSMKFTGVILMVLPAMLKFLIPVTPQPAPVFTDVSTLESQFIFWTLACSLLMWLILGAASCWIFDRLQSSE